MSGWRFCHSDISKKSRSLPVKRSLTLQALWHYGHGSILGADESTDLNSGLVSLGNGLAVEDAAHERTCEGIAGTDGIGYLYLRGLLERHLAWREYVRAIGAAGEYEHIEVVLAQNQPALVLDVEAGIAEHTANEYQLLIVDLQDVTTLQRLLDYLLGIELLAQVDIENLHTVIGCGVEELVDILTRNDITLSQ